MIFKKKYTTLKKTKPSIEDEILLHKKVRPELKNTNHILFVGRSGAGKTVSGCFSEIERAIENKENIYIFGREKEYNYMLDKCSKSGYRICESPSSNFQITKNKDSLSITYCYSPVTWFNDTRKERISQFQTNLKHLCESLFVEDEDSSPSVIIIDDIGLYELPEDFWGYFRNARKKGIRFVFTIFTFRDIFETDTANGNSKYEQILRNSEVVLIGSPVPYDYNIISKYYLYLDVNNDFSILHRLPHHQMYLSPEEKYFAVQFNGTFTKEKDVLNSYFTLFGDIRGTLETPLTRT